LTVHEKGFGLASANYQNAVGFKIA
jgi:hypothetical protein